MKSPVPKTREKINKEEYPVLINLFCNSKSFLAIATVSLFLNPFPKPKSKKFNQRIMELTISQMPYLSELT
jgi:hypothetical protein